ncbi:phage late control D family protein [Sebaldella termitidis]|uniref:phage late control D family protein n=1 Tax=Sebaldella termitidis TaxID=826 RepID=UPI003EB98CAA
MLSRETWLHVEYDDKDISTEIQPYITGFTYNDNAKNEIDDIELTLENSDGRWFNEWFPDEGAKLTVSIIKKRWSDELIEETLPCGTFYIDQIDLTPGIISLKALAIPMGNLKNQVNSVAWEKISLQGIATDISNKHTMTLQFYVNEEIRYERVDQDKEADLVFLNRLCVEEGLSLKLTDNKIVIFDNKDFENNDEVIEISRIYDTEMLKDYSFSRTNKEIYDKVEISYYDPDKKALVRETITKEELEKRKETENQKNKKSKAEKRNEKQQTKNTKNSKNGKTLKVNSSAKDSNNKKKAEKALEKENKEKETVNMTLIGNFKLLAGQNITLKDFGYFDGKYFIEKAVHSLDSGYTTEVELKKVNV